MQQLNGLQQRLESIYEVDLGYQITDFVITDPVLAQQLDSSDNPRASTEKLLVRQGEDGLELSLYLDEALLAGWSHDEEGLKEGEMADFCTILEGVSHFVYLCWNALQGREVSCLELEMQAEVDKFIMLVSTLSFQDGGLHPRQLHDWLFEQASFDQMLSQTELIRYRDANHFAGKYCHRLTRTHLRQTGLDSSMLNELRRFYRLSLHHKLRRIERLN
ncbi:MAG: hypothetical protein KDK04_24815 [Candidatus Competibacteraceae bacterium]|jgi:hypothetical protein|nr:hypothetical protein [Candidatus Competibacteraceae bacterium]MCB1808868.1 hypothetical protein [Candidatus Competibacteraceae bacterium]MCB1814910.1 hypothetical protein [Candidatus Competibacteraceae bacterium]